MQHERLQPGAHLRKNTKQILAMVRASAQRAGLACEFEQPSSSRARADLVPAGAAAIGSVELHFTTDGIEAVMRAGTTERRALALYTDTRWMMEELDAFLAAAPR
jgi:hypothetical protein